MRRSTIFEGIHHEAKLLLRFLVGQADSLEDSLLHFTAMDTDGAATDLGAVQNHIICLSIYLAGVGFQERQVFVTRRGERMVHSHIAFFFLVVLEHREVNNPGEGQLVGVNQVQAFSHFNTQCAQSSSYYGGFISYEEQQVAGLSLSSCQDTVHLFFGKEFSDGRFNSAIC